MANGVTYNTGQRVTQDGLAYTIHCSSDNSQGAYDIVGVNSGSFSKCFDACDASSKCQGWTYSGTDSGNCYLKSSEGSYSNSSSTIVSAFIAGQRPDGSSASGPSSSHAPSATASVSPSSCKAIGTGDGKLTPYTDQNGRKYSIACKYEIGGSLLAVQSAATFDDCFPICDKMSGCAGFAWLQDNGPGNCYFKSNFDNVNTIGPSPADVAIMVDFPLPSGPAVPSSTASSTPSHAPSGGCSTFHASNYPGWTIECQTDRDGGNLKAVSSSSFEGCSPICEETSQCIGFSYVGGTGPGTCYLKQELVAPNANNNVDTAYITEKRPLPSQPSSSSASRSPTSNPPSDKSFPDCWAPCFRANGLSKPQQLCDNQDVGTCIQRGCSWEDYKSYVDWEMKYCNGGSGWQ